MRRAMPAMSAIVLGLLVPSCYLVHERERERERDAAVTPDTNVPGCMETPPRPPSDPASPPPPGQPALVVANTRDIVNIASLAVDGERLLLTTTDEPSGEPHLAVLGLTGDVVTPADLASLARSPEHRLVRDESAPGVRFVVLDDDYAPSDRGFTSPGTGADQYAWAWMPWRQRWLLASAPPRGSRATPVGLDVFDEMGGAHEHLVVHAADAADVQIQIAATENDALALIQDPRHTLQAVLLGGDPLVVRAGPFDLLVSEALGNASPTLVRYGDRYLVTGFDYHEVRVSLVDPSDCGRTRVQPVVVAPTGVREPAAQIAVAQDHGFFAVCYEEGPRLEDTTMQISRAMVQVMGDDGSRWGEPLAMTPVGQPSSTGACVWNGHDVWVTYATPGHSFLARLSPTFL